MALLALQAHNEVAGVDVPHTNALVERSGRDIAAVRGDGDGSNAVLNRQVEYLLIGLKIPKADAPIAASGCNDAAVLRKVERVDVLLMAGELMLDRAACDIPNPDHLVLGTCSKVLAVGAEADAADIQVAILGEACVLEMSNRRSALDVEDLSGAVAASCDIATISAEPHTTDDALVREVVNQLDVQDAPCARVENSEPVLFFLLEVRWKRLQVKVSQYVALAERNPSLGWAKGVLLVWRRSGAGHLG